MADFTIRVRGLKELDAALRALPREMQGPPVRAGLKAAGAVLVDGMSARAPRDQDVAGVTLADEIVADVTISLAKDTAMVQVGPSKRAFYGGFQELGTSRHAAQPFMRPTLEQDGETAIAALAAHLKVALERAAQRLGRKQPT